MTQQRTDVICDFLSVTFSPDDSPYYELISHFEGLGFMVDSKDMKCTYIATPLGDNRLLIRLETSLQFHKLSIGGYTLDHLRMCSLLDGVLALCASVPHRVTRLDAAYDVRRDAPDIFRSLDRKYPDGKVKLTRKSTKLRKLLSVRDDGLQSGTYYIGKPTSKVHARIYDKSLEAFEKRGEKYPFSVTRYEITVTEGVTLRDVVMPDGVFWAYASPSLLKRPPDAPEWVKSDSEGWHYTKPDKLPVDVLKHYLDNSTHLPRMVEIADEMGPNGRAYLLSQFTRLLDRSPADGLTGPKNLQ